MKSIFGSMVLAGVALCGTGAAMAAPAMSHSTTNFRPGAGASPCPRPDFRPGAGVSLCPRPWMAEMNHNKK